MRKLWIAPFVLALAATVSVACQASPVANTIKPATRGPGFQPAKGGQPITRAELIKNLDAQFKALDTNGDGVLSQSELAAAEAKFQQQRVMQIRARMEAEFDRLDTNHNGALSKAELMAAAPQPSITPPDVSADFAQFDKKRDGRVTADEYQAAMLGRFDALDKQHTGSVTAGGSTVTRAQFASTLANKFKQIDAGGHGYFTKADLQAAEQRIREQRIAAARARMEAEFGRLDVDHDGTLTKAEFLAAAPQLPKTLPNGADLMAKLDKNHDGKVTLDEYRAPVLERFDRLPRNTTASSDSLDKSHP